MADRIAQTVVAMFLERLVEPIFHPDSAPVMVTTRLLPSGYGLPHARYFIARLRGPDKYWKVTLLDGSGHKVPFRSY